ncbi:MULTISPECIES: DUF2484 family protein [unclassified Paracoccus (in: a-proteobacteria)]|uniref:DUF2484 family protein n=1 Tax=unclassified Paracoccus (in: a-proteobacteria) TaxID=2688777 RepID=UPI0012B3E808|nr:MULTISPECIES: DUF2484 family protein [unclassified Paracoccus (in: a-proteobacteria)]UXU74897.1 DUF2484 family protein [Paracoccus sp. SMMA_5]UXU80799.1 DUF2484 family protein [Paracoccus sp. SMMA_5_TC]
MILLASHPLIAAGCAILWGICACLLPRVSARKRSAMLWGLVLTGVPVLGWLTYLLGPVFGVLFLSLGLSLLVWPPFGGRGRRGDAH